MTQTWLYSLAAVGVVSLISLLGVVTLAVQQETLKRWLLYLVSFSAGALLGDVFIHMLPEMAETSLGVREGIYILGGILLFFVLERFVLWHHHHGEHRESVHSVAYLTTLGDSLHNFIDGMIIAGSFLVSTPLGIATTIAVVFHEIPQEIGNFAILIHGGWKRTKALWYNFLSALTSVLGAVVVLLTAKAGVEPPTFLLSLGVASFMYIAVADIIPELHEEMDRKKSMLQFLCLLLGIVVMAGLLVLE